MATKGFYERLSADAQLTARLAALVGDKDGFEALEAIAVFAAASGYDVTLEDVEAVHRRILRKGPTSAMNAA